MTSKKESRKREIERTDVQLNHALSCLNSSLKKTDKQDPSGLETMDKDDFYALSLAKQLRKLESRHKALMRNGIEKLFLDIVFGGKYSFNTPQPIPPIPFLHFRMAMFRCGKIICRIHKAAQLHHIVSIWVIMNDINDFNNKTKTKVINIVS